LVERSPEKAGVGGSIPSLATIDSVAYRPPDSQFHSVSFQIQKWSTEICLRVDLRVWSLFAVFRKILLDQFSIGDDAEDLYGIEQSFSLLGARNGKAYEV
jgi:hypothetical protein